MEIITLVRFLVITRQLLAQTVKRLFTVRETWVRSLGREDSLEKEMTTHSVLLPRKSHGPRSVVSMGSQRVRHNWATTLSLFYSYTLHKFLHINLGIKRSWKKVTTQNCVWDWVWIKPVTLFNLNFFFFSFSSCATLSPHLNLKELKKKKKKDTLHDLQVPGKGRIYWSTNWIPLPYALLRYVFLKCTSVARISKAKAVVFFFPCQTLLSNQQPAGEARRTSLKESGTISRESECFGRIVAIGRFLFTRSPICSESGVLIRASGDSGQSGLSLDVFPLPTELRRSRFPRCFGLGGKDGILNPCPRPVI